MTKQPKLRFPKKFLWGVSTSAHQVEGGNHNQWSVWELENAKALAAQAAYKLDELDDWARIKRMALHPTNYVSSRAVDHYHRYEEDFDITKSLNMNAFRFSVEWSRIEPEEGKWDRHEIEHYQRYIAQLRKRNLQPVLTLFHFTLPEWFVEKGGFEKRRNVEYFVRYAEQVMTHIAKDVTYIITINEPEIYAAQGYLSAEWPPQEIRKIAYIKVMHNQIVAHNKVARMIHNLARGHKVSIAKNVAHYYAGDASKISLLTTKMLEFVHNEYLLRRVMSTCDFIGVNYYFSNRLYGTQVHNSNEKMSDLGWDMHPEEIQFVLERLHTKYGKPILVTENGVADMHDTKRKWWLAHTLQAISLAIQNGAVVEGYLHWSLLDNFEWAHGKWPRFGLVGVNYATMERTVRPSGKWFGTIVGKLRKDSW